jgi:hypothetical protein
MTALCPFCGIDSVIGDNRLRDHQAVSTGNA